MVDSVGFISTHENFLTTLPALISSKDQQPELLRVRILEEDYEKRIFRLDIDFNFRRRDDR